MDKEGKSKILLQVEYRQYLQLMGMCYQNMCSYPTKIKSSLDYELSSWQTTMKNLFIDDCMVGAIKILE